LSLYKGYFSNLEIMLPGHITKRVSKKMRTTKTILSALLALELVPIVKS
jgi:hypothetical protein